MYYLQKLCTICLGVGKKLIKLKDLSNEINLFYNKLIDDAEKITHETEDLDYICVWCYVKLKTSCQFWMQCVNNKNTLISYVRQLTHNDNYERRELIADLSKKIQNQESLTEEKCEKTEDSIEEIWKVKEECVVKQEVDDDDDCVIVETNDDALNVTVKVEEHFQRSLKEMNKHQEIVKLLNTPSETENTASQSLLGEILKRPPVENVQPSSIYPYENTFYDTTPPAENVMPAPNLDTYSTVPLYNAVPSPYGVTQPIYDTTVPTYSMNAPYNTVSPPYNIVTSPDTTAYTPPLPYPVATGSDLLEAEICKQLSVPSESYHTSETSEESQYEYISSSFNVQESSSQVVAEEILGETDLTNSTWFCAECNKYFTSEKFLQMHLQSHKEKPYVCSVCFKRFTLVTHLRRHRKIHSAATYKCEICFRKCSNALSLEIHMKNHKEYKAFLCDICNKTFAHATNFKQHYLMHENRVGLLKNKFRSLMKNYV